MIISNVKIAKSLFDQIFGLINSHNPRQMLFFTRFGIHTFGLSHHIDILILNKYYRIVKLKENLPPNRLFFWHPSYQIALEVPAGTIKRNKLKLGEHITIQTAKVAKR